MDPNSVLESWLDSPDREEREALAEWLNRGGFRPRLELIVEAYEYCRDSHSGQGSEEYAMLCLLNNYYKGEVRQ